MANPAQYVNDLIRHLQHSPERNFVIDGFFSKV